MSKHTDQGNGGRIDADLFLQSLADHGDAMTHIEAGEAFAQVVCDQMGVIARAADAGIDGDACDDAKHFYAFLVRIGEALHQLSEMEREQRNAFSFDGGELRRLIAHAHDVAGTALCHSDNLSFLADAATAVVKDLRAMQRLLGTETDVPDAAANKQVAQVISLALVGAARKKGGGDGG